MQRNRKLESFTRENRPVASSRITQMLELAKMNFQTAIMTTILLEVEENMPVIKNNNKKPRK